MDEERVDVGADEILHSLANGLPGVERLEEASENEEGEKSRDENSGKG